MGRGEGQVTKRQTCIQSPTAWPLPRRQSPIQMRKLPTGSVTRHQRRPGCDRQQQRPQETHRGRLGSAPRILQVRPYWRRHKVPLQYESIQRVRAHGWATVLFQPISLPSVCADAKIPVVPVEFSPPFDVLNGRLLHTEEVLKLCQGSRGPVEERSAPAT